MQPKTRVLSQKGHALTGRTGGKNSVSFMGLVNANADIFTDLFTTWVLADQCYVA